MGTGRWRVQFVEETEQLPMVWHAPLRRQEIRQAPGEIGKAALVAAFQLLACRGTGPLAWAASLRHDPIAFLLDTSSDAITLWGSQGELLYRNRTAERLGLGRCEETAWEVLTAGDRRLERRCCRVRYGNARYVLEIIGEGADPVAMDIGQKEEPSTSAQWNTSSSNAAA
jgi:hypothetical protein